MKKEERQDLLYLEVAADIRRAIADGEAKPGSDSHRPRDLATVLGVDTKPSCARRACFRTKGRSSFGAGRGITVAGTPERGAVMQKVGELVEFAAARDTPSTSSSR